MFHHSLDNILRKQICTNDASGKELAKAKKDNATIISDKRYVTPSALHRVTDPSIPYTPHSYESNINLCNPIQSEEPFEEGAPSTILRDLQELRPSNEKQVRGRSKNERGLERDERGVVKHRVNLRFALKHFVLLARSPPQDPSYSVYKHGNHIYHYGNLLVICASPMCKDEMYMGDARGRVVYANSPRLASSDWENDSKLYEVSSTWYLRFSSRIYPYFLLYPGL